MKEFTLTNHPLRRILMDVDPAAIRTRPSLLIRLRDVGDADAWRTFVTIYAPLVHRFGRRQGLQDADVADLTQDVLGEVCRAIRSFEYQPARGRFRDWLLAITRRRSARFQERRARYQPTVLDDQALEGLEDDRTDADWNDAFHARVLRVALERIQPSFHPQTWRAFECVWLENRTAAETAEALSLGIDIVYTAKSRVLKRLSEEVEEIAAGFSWLDALESP
jgi:RNA polymerase sigma factor (sigma-70 family)